MAQLTRSRVPCAESLVDGWMLFTDKASILSHWSECFQALSIAGKILAYVHLNSLVPTVTEDHLPETQCSFRANRVTTDMFIFGQLQEKCWEQNKGLYITFVGLTKVFDTMSRKGLWMIMECLGCPPKFLSMVTELHKDQRGQVRLDIDLSGPFPIINGMKQVCVLAPNLFSIFFSMTLKHATGDLDDDNAVYIHYHLDGSLFNIRRLQVHTKKLDQLFHDLLRRVPASPHHHRRD